MDSLPPVCPAAVNPEKLRQHFPFFQAHPHLVYLDSAATTHKPQVVLDAVTESLIHSANGGRATYALAAQAWHAVAHTRQMVATFFDHPDPQSVIFTPNASHALNLVATHWLPQLCSPGDEVVFCPTDHHANVDPWITAQQHLAALGIPIRLVPVGADETGVVTAEALARVLTSRTRVVALTHVHNVFGNCTDIASIRAVVPPRVVLVVDGAQSAGHLPVSTTALGADFFAFSGHKMLAPSGIGALLVHPRWMSVVDKPPATGEAGGSSRRPGHPGELGTPAYAALAGLTAAMQFLSNVGLEAVHQHLRMVTGHLLTQLHHVPGLSFLPGVVNAPGRPGYGIVSVRLQGWRADELAALCEQENICVRTGSHCNASPQEVGDSLRISLHLYSTLSDVERIVDVLTQASRG